MKELHILKEEIIEVGKLMYEKGLIAATDGNISAKISNTEYMITSTGICKGRMTTRDILIINMEGEVLEGIGRPSSEFRMHSLVYSIRKDVEAIVHAHPPILTAFTLSNFEFNSAWLPELWLSVGPVAIAPYATPSTPDVPASIEPYVRNHDAILLTRHGSITFGNSVISAYNKLEKLEHAAHVAMITRILTGKLPEPLTSEEIKQLELLIGTTH